MYLRETKNLAEGLGPGPLPLNPAPGVVGSVNVSSLYQSHHALHSGLSFRNTLSNCQTFFIRNRV